MSKRETFAAQLAPESFDDSDGSIGLVVYTGAKVARYDWMTGEEYTLAMDVTPEAVDLERLDAGTAPLLDSHSDYSTAEVLGVLIPGSATFDGGALRVRARLSVDPDKAGKVADIKAGILRAVSVGAMIMASKTTEATKKKSPNDVQHVLRHVQATRWQMQEASIVPIGADPNAQTFSRQEPPVEAPPAQEPKIMDEAQLAAAKEEGAKTERMRLVGIDQAALATKADPTHVAKLKAEGVDLDVARAALITAAADRDAANPVHTQISLVRDAGDTAIEMAQHALLAKAIPGNITAKFDGTEKRLWDGSKARQFRGRRTMDIVRATLAAIGHDVDNLSDRQVARRALLTISSSDLPDLFGDTVGKALLYGYMAATKQYEPFCSRVTTPGLHARTAVGVGGSTEAEEIAEGAPYAQGAISDTAESYSAKKYGKMLSFTQEALMRDNLEVITKAPTVLANSLILKQNSLVAALFAAGSGYGPTLAQDSVALFNSAHANLVDTGSGGVPTIARIAALRTLLAKQVDAAGNQQPRQGKIIVVPAELAHTAEALLYGAAMPSSLSVETRVPSMGGLQIVQFDALASAAYWYLFADPSMAPVIEVASPDNEPEAWADSQINWNTDAREFKAGMYFAAAVVDFHGAAMNRGA